MSRNAPPLPAQLRRRPNCVASVLVSQASSRSSNATRHQLLGTGRLRAIVRDRDVARIQTKWEAPYQRCRTGSAMLRSQLVRPSGMAPFTASHRQGRPSPIRLRDRSRRHLQPRDLSEHDPRILDDVEIAVEGAGGRLHDRGGVAVSRGAFAAQSRRPNCQAPTDRPGRERCQIHPSCPG
jgi:hypothetical protein